MSDPTANQPTLPPASGPVLLQAAEPPGAPWRVRTGLRAGQWQCTSCEGQISGDQFFRPTCGFCQAV
jgi:hypothetical protein